MSRRTFVLLVSRTVGVLGGFAFASLVLVFSNLASLGAGMSRHGDWHDGFPLGLVSFAFLVAAAGWVCWSLGPEICEWLERNSPARGGQYRLDAGIALVGCYAAAIQILTDSAGHELDRWKTIQLFGSIDPWELASRPYLDKSFSPFACIGVAACALAATIIVRRLADRGNSMQSQTNISLSRRDAGFIAARTLAVFGWIYGLTSFVGSLTEVIRYEGAASQGVQFAVSYDLIGHGVIYGIAMAAVSAWLWTQAERFGGEAAVDESDQVLVSRDSILRGVVASVGIVFGARGVSPVLMWAYDLVAPRAGFPSVVPPQIVEGFVNLAVSVALLLWVVRRVDPTHVPVAPL